MAWTKADKDALNSFKRNVDCDNTRFKQRIKEELLNNRFLIHVLNNKNLDEEEPDSYFPSVIMPHYCIDHTVTNVENWICYTVSHKELARYNKIIKYGQITFYILCNIKNIVDEDTGMDRHDLLAALILHQFNQSNIFGNQIKCVENTETVVDGDYISRVLVFEGEFLNGILRTENGDTKVINNKVNTGGKPIRI